MKPSPMPRTAQAERQGSSQAGSAGKQRAEAGRARRAAATEAALVRYRRRRGQRRSPERRGFLALHRHLDFNRRKQHDQLRWRDANDHDPLTIGTSDTVVLGTVSDLIFGPGNDCEILADVADRVASLNDATAECSFSDDDYAYDQTVDNFQFAVSGNGRTAISRLTTTVYVYDLVGNPVSVCDSDTTTEFSR